MKKKLVMNEYKFENLKIGQQESFVYQITDQSIDDFCKLTGNNTPLHMDDDFARSVGFKNRLQYGMMTASLISTLAGVYLPGKYSICQKVVISFLSPVYSGDVLKVIGTVIELNDTVKQCVIKVDIFNQNSVRVLKGKLEVGFTK